MGRSFTFSGRIADDDAEHSIAYAAQQLIAPIYVTVPGGQRIPQYSPTVVDSNNNYGPPTNCGGNFMSSRFQRNNNCYNYACNIASNSFAQPGRKQGVFLTGAMQGPEVLAAAQLDGLMAIGGSNMPLSALQSAAPYLPTGHFVALFVSPADLSVSWPGDFHWVRCDVGSPFDSWSQKDGTDQVTNFDFAGAAINDPSLSNWTVNQGPIVANSLSEVVINYQFFAWLYVPYGMVDII
jgi:hypothetical protein